MTLDLNNTNDLLKVQGDLCEVHQGENVYILTVVHVIDVGKRSLRLVNRASKSHRPDWPLSPSLLAAMHEAPAGHPEGAKWLLKVRAAS